MLKELNGQVFLCWTSWDNYWHSLFGEGNIVNCIARPKSCMVKSPTNSTKVSDNITNLYSKKRTPFSGAFVFYDEFDNIRVREMEEMLLSINLAKETATRKLDLRKEALKISLVKKSLTTVTARVGVVLDKSGSMRKLYKDGSVQDVLERLFPIALNFDDNGELDVWLFNDEFIRMKESVTLDNFYNYIDSKVMSGVIEKFWGQTKYAPVMRDVFNKYCIEDPSPLPTFVIFLTDGNNSDKNNTKQILKESSAHNIFWEFVGIGDEKFEFLQRLDSLSGRTIDNANFFDVKDIASLSDEYLYDKLLYEYPQWEAEAKRVGILR